MAANYVKFFRGSKDAYENSRKNKDTLYFITESDESTGSLYLGPYLIAGNITSLEGLEDIVLNELDNKDLLSYDKELGKWVNKSIIDAIGMMTGATDETPGLPGLVPESKPGSDNLFLRGDGQWASPEDTSNIEADNRSTQINEGYIVTLKNYGQKYYKYLEDSNTYIEQIVDEDHPWLAGLEPRVTNENGELVLGWYEPNTSTIDGVQSEITQIKTDVEGLKNELDSKANADEVYTSKEVDEKIAEAITAVDHLKRQTFNSLAEAQEFANREDIDPEQYIFMVLDNEASGNNKYLEYIWLDGDLEWIGSYEVDLSEYVKKEELIAYAKVGDLNDYLKKEDQLFESVSSDFTITQAKVLTLNTLNPTKIEGLNDLMTNFSSVQAKVLELDQEQTVLKAKVGSLEELTKDLNSKFISTTDFKAVVGDLDFMKENNINLLNKIDELETALTWQDMI